MRKIFSLIFIIIVPSLTAQIYNVSGVVKDLQSGKKLSFANIRTYNSIRGTSSNTEGAYSIKLIEGDYSLIASFIGYKSDTIQANVTKNLTLNFELQPIELDLPEVTVTPGRNPAYDIIEKAIKRKNEIKEKIENYKYSAYTKGLVKTTRDIQEGGFSLSTQDTGKLKINGIIENESRGFYKAPDSKKNFIVARKQSANTPPFINVLTGGNVIQSFYEDDLLFLGSLIPSPISNKALSYYYFYIEKEIAQDDKKIYQIYFNTDNPADPGFYGNLFIADSTFHLLKS
jgi:hypothetical protein